MSNQIKKNSPSSDEEVNQPAPTVSEIEKRMQKKQIAELEKDEVVAQLEKEKTRQALEKLKNPPAEPPKQLDLNAPAIEAPKDTITVGDEVSVEVHLQAYEALERAARSVGKYLWKRHLEKPQKSGARFRRVLLTTALLNEGGDFFLYHTILLQLDHLTEQLKAAVDRADKLLAPKNEKNELDVKASAPLLQAGLQTALNALPAVISMLSSDIKVQAVAVEAKDRALLVDVAGALTYVSGRTLDIRYPSLYVAPPHDSLSEKAQGKSLRKKVQESAEQRRNAQHRIHLIDTQLEQEPPEEEKDEAEETPPDPLAIVREELEALGAAFDALWATLTKIEDGRSLLARLLEVDYYVAHLQAEDTETCLLLLNILAIGGNVQVHTNIWRRLWGKPSITHMGGVVVQYVLVGKDGQVIDADVIRAYRGYDSVPKDEGKISDSRIVENYGFEDSERYKS